MLNSRVEANRVHSLSDCYKVKLRSSGYRLVYQVIDQEVVVFVVAIDKREREQAYHKAAERVLSKSHDEKTCQKAGFLELPRHSLERDELDMVATGVEDGHNHLN